MKNFYVTLMAALLAGTSLAQAQSIQLQRMPSTQQQTVTATRSLLPSEASTLPMTSKVAPVADTLAASIPELAIPVGYASFTPASENISAVGSGAPISNLYGSAIELNSPQLTGTNIFAIRFFLYSAVGCESLEVFITEDLAGTSLVSQQVENPVSGWNYVVLDEPLSLEGRSKLFIGYYYQGSASYALSFERSQTGVDTNADWYAQLTPEGQLAWSHMSTDGLGAVKNLVFAMMDTETPSMDKLGITAGFSFRPDAAWSVDFAFSYITGFGRDGSYPYTNLVGQEDPFGGHYKAYALMPSVGVSYAF